MDLYTYGTGAFFSMDGQYKMQHKSRMDLQLPCQTVVVTKQQLFLLF